VTSLLIVDDAIEFLVIHSKEGFLARHRDPQLHQFSARLNATLRAAAFSIIPNHPHELPYFALESIALLYQRARRRQHLNRTRPGFVGSATDLNNVGCNLRRSLSGLLSLVRDFARCGALLLHCRRDARRNLGHPVDRIADPFDSSDRLLIPLPERIESGGLR
jgi:hypothetical protein